MSDFVWLNDESRQFLERDYLVEGQTVEQRVDVICATAERILGIEGFGERFKENLKKGWYSLSSPIWTNFGNSRGLPISCFGSHIDDSMESILATHCEVGTMTKYGGGTSGYFGDLRPRGSKINQNGESSGAVHFMQLFDRAIEIISQGSSRRGQFAAYLPIEHKDAEEFLTIRSEGSKIQSMSTGVCVSDAFMRSMIDGDPKARALWAKVLNSRANTGYPYIFFTDNANRGRPLAYLRAGAKIRHSNLCTEIMLPDDWNESFVCDLSSLNILHYEAWKDTDAVELLVYFLDAVMTEFIEKACTLRFMGRAVRFARRHRALGVGWVGWHSFLQSKGIPFENFMARSWNAEIAKNLWAQGRNATRKLAVDYGEPHMCKGLGARNTTLFAIAPTKSSAFILGQVSEGIEPHRSNYYIKDLQKGKFTYRNPYLVTVLTALGKNDEQTWQSILQNAGSVAHLSFLSERDKAVFRTFAEISPMEIISQAAQRQTFIDQGQSINLMIHPSIPVKDVNALVIKAWELGIKSLYYQFSVNAAQQFSRDIMACTACEA